MTLELLKFEAEWCAPCSQQKEILSEFDLIPVREIDIDENQEMAQDYEVRGLPTLILENDGETVKRWAGLTQLNEIEDTVESHRYS